MQFMLLIKASPEYEAGIPPSAELMAGMAKLTEEGRNAGIAEITIEVRPLFGDPRFSPAR